MSREKHRLLWLFKILEEVRKHNGFSTFNHMCKEFTCTPHIEPKLKECPLMGCSNEYSPFYKVRYATRKEDAIKNIQFIIDCWKE